MLRTIKIFRLYAIPSEYGEPNWANRTLRVFDPSNPLLTRLGKKPILATTRPYELELRIHLPICQEGVREFLDERQKQPCFVASGTYCLLLCINGHFQSALPRETKLISYNTDSEDNIYFIGRKYELFNPTVNELYFPITLHYSNHP